MVQTMANTNRGLRDYSHMHATIHCGTNRQYNVIHDPLVTPIITQYHVYKGLKVFGDPRVTAVLKYLKQLYDRMVMDPKNSDEMTKCREKAALQYLIFPKKKRCGKIEVRGCADRRKHHEYFIKYDASAPTVEIEALSLSCLINTM